MKKYALKGTGQQSELVKESLLYLFCKRMMDMVAAILALILLSPMLIVVAILIKIESDGPIIFKQERVGLRGKYFNIYKFRSMVIDAEKLKKKLESQNEMSGPMFKIKNDPRVTRVGRFIRKTSIDEFPQLLNVLKGEMSLVGPRPSLPNEVEKFEPWMLKRLTIKPGLTCYWQVSGRNNIGFQEWMKMDICYVNKRNLWIDIKLIFKTLRVLSGDENAS